MNFQQSNALCRKTYGRNHVLKTQGTDSGPFAVLKPLGAVSEDTLRRRDVYLLSQCKETIRSLVCPRAWVISHLNESLGRLPNKRISHRDERQSLVPILILVVDYFLSPPSQHLLLLVLFPGFTQSPVLELSLHQSHLLLANLGKHCQMFSISI